MRLMRGLAIGIVIGFVAPAAPATVALNWVPVTIDLFSDSSGANIVGYRCYDLITSLTPGDDFQSMRLFMTPPTNGQFFQHIFGQGPPNYGPPNLAILSFPMRVFDTFLDDNGNFVVEGATDGTSNLPPPAIFNTAQLAVWGEDSLINSTGGFLRLLRATFNGDGLPTVLGRVYTAQTPEGTPIPSEVPEPTTSTLLALATLLPKLLCRTRSCPRASSARISC